MAAKTCLLCGKTLSRIWAGGGEDFCSREHRNQYRLRRGMDRLQEANKVASVMRRRESPRNIAAARLVNPGVQMPRGFLQPKTVEARAAGGIPTPRLATAFRPRLAADPGAVPPSPVAAGLPGRRAGLSVALSFPVSSATATPSIAPRMPVRLAQAPFAAVADSLADMPYSRRMLMSAWRCGTRTVVGEMMRRIAAPEINPVDAVRSARRVAAPSRGRALRVSLALGFQITRTGPPQIVIGQPPAACMTWPVMINLSEEPLDPQIEPIVESLPIATPGMRIPAAPPADFDGRFRWPGALELPLQFVSPLVRHRTAFVPFGYAEEGRGKEPSNEYRN